MKPSKKIYLLAGTAAALAVVYLLTLFFDPERSAARSASFVWLSGEGRDNADRIEITGPGEEKFVMIRRDGKWLADRGVDQFPVKQGRVEDLLRILGVRGAFPKRGESASSHEELSLSSATAYRLVIRAGPSVEPLLDLMVGAIDTPMREVYLRKNGQNEYRSGDKLIRTYVSGASETWYNLKPFEEGESGIDGVQRIQIRPYKDGEGDEDFTLVRSGGGWVFENSPGVPSNDLVSIFLRGLFAMQADNFLPRGAAEGIEFNAARVTLEMGDGLVFIFQGAEERDGFYPAVMSGTPVVYLLTGYVRERFFREKASLIETPGA